MSQQRYHWHHKTGSSRMINADEEKEMIGKHCIVRTEKAGVFAGVLAERNGSEVIVHNARRIWYWVGAATLSQLATQGTSKPNECKFPVTVSEVLLLGVIEIILMTDDAVASIASVPVWSE